VTSIDSDAADYCSKTRVSEKHDMKKEEETVAMDYWSSAATEGTIRQRLVVQLVFLIVVDQKSFFSAVCRSSKPRRPPR
jgi:hypothetical protein